MNEMQLREALERASAHVDSPPWAERALEERTRCVRRRQALVAGAAAVVLAVSSATWGLHRDGEQRLVPVNPPTPTASSTDLDSSDVDLATQPRWDPFTVADVPTRPSVLPPELRPPDSPPSIAESPLRDIVVAWPEESRDLRLLDSAGEWRSVPGTATAIKGSLRDVVRPSISPDGSRVAMATDAGVLVVAADGGDRVIAWPAQLEGPFDTRPRVLWLPEDEGFVVLHWQRPWLIGLDGSASPAPFGAEHSDGVTVDPDDGTVLERNGSGASLVTWQDGDVTGRVGPAGYGERLVTRFGLVAYTGSPAGEPRPDLRAGPVVVDAGSGETLGYAPIRDTDSVYGDNGYLSALGFLDPGSVVLLVGPMDFRTMDPGDERWHLVSWDFHTGDFERITSGDTRMRGIAVAPALLDR